MWHQSWIIKWLKTCLCKHERPQMHTAGQGISTAPLRDKFSCPILRAFWEGLQPHDQEHSVLGGMLSRWPNRFGTLPRVQPGLVFGNPVHSRGLKLRGRYGLFQSRLFYDSMMTFKGVFSYGLGKSCHWFVLMCWTYILAFPGPLTFPHLFIWTFSPAPTLRCATPWLWPSPNEGQKGPTMREDVGLPHPEKLHLKYCWVSVLGRSVCKELPSQ